MATNTQGTVLNVLQIISDLRGESSVNSNSDRIRAVSRANRDFALRRFWRTHYLKDQTISSSGTGDETIGSTLYPMRMKGLSEVFIGGTTGSAAGSSDLNQSSLDTTNYFTVTWSAVTSAIGYNVYGRKDGKWFFLKYLEGNASTMLMMGI